MQIFEKKSYKNSCTGKMQEFEKSQKKYSSD